MGTPPSPIAISQPQTTTQITSNRTLNGSARRNFSHNQQIEQLVLILFPFIFVLFKIKNYIY